MTVKELIELNDHIGDITIMVRDENMILLKEYFIGAGAFVLPEKRNERIDYMDFSINAFDEDKDRYQLLINKIPKNLLGLTVSEYSSRRAGRRYFDRHSLDHIDITVRPDGWQMDITDFPEVLP